MTDISIGSSSDSDSSYVPECQHPLPVKGVEPQHFDCEFCECICVDCESNLFDTTKCQHDSNYICDYCEAKYVDDIEADELMNHGDFIDDSSQPDNYYNEQQMDVIMNSSINTEDEDSE